MIFLRLLRFQSDLTWTLLDASAVVAQRLDDLTDISPAATGERVRMLAEKQTAFAAANFDAMSKVIQGAHPVVVMEAALHPIKDIAKANRRRLDERLPPGA